jgi:hypothetical protein
LANPKKANDSLWDGAKDDFLKSPRSAKSRFERGIRGGGRGGIQSLTLGAILESAFIRGVIPVQNVFYI